jgi:two-component system OmpR family response regulator
MLKGTILCVDDDQNIQDVLGHYLESDGYICLKSITGEEALSYVQTHKIDVILLDLVLPDMEGLNLINLMRDKTNAAIIVVSGKLDTTEKIICLEMGADDYITKPFEMRELSARIKAVLRRTNKEPTTTITIETQSQNGILQFLDWTLAQGKYQLFDSSGNSLDLTTGEFKLLEALALSANRVLSREQLFDLTRVGRFDVYDRAIDIQIARIRKKLGDDGAVVKTVRGVGYMLAAEVKAA